MIAPCGRVLRTPPLVAASLLARLPLGIPSLALVLFVEEVKGSFAAARGAVTAAFGRTGRRPPP
jgi:hypothetical protein